MRDIPTVYGLMKRSKPSSHDEAITELSRLEHEKVRLERELALWRSNEKRTQQRLQTILNRVALLQAFVDGRSSEAASPHAVSGPENEEAVENEQWATVRLEY
jgi:hypothetical protein